MRIALDFPSDPRLLQVVRSVVGQVASLSGFGEDETQFIILAVDEACSNVMRHAYEGRTDGQIRLSCSADSERLEFVLVDRGRAPQPERMRPRSLDEIRPGGLGLHLIQSVMDEVRFCCREQENELYLAKFLRPQKKAQTGVVKE